MDQDFTTCRTACHCMQFSVGGLYGLEQSLFGLRQFYGACMGHFFTCQHTVARSAAYQAPFLLVPLLVMTGYDCFLG